MPKVSTVFFYPQGTYYASDLQRNNVPEECGEWYVMVLRDMLYRGVIDESTIVNLPGVYSGTVGGLRAIKGF